MSQILAEINYGSSKPGIKKEEKWSIDAVSEPGRILWSFQSSPETVGIKDLRHSDWKPTLDVSGFQMIASRTTADQKGLYARDASALQLYLEETEALLKSVTGAHSVHFFDATLREESTETPRAPGFQGAHRRAHVDQNPSSARARLAKHVGERTFDRFQIVNVWRPILRPISNYPLALCDYRSLDLETDLVPTRLIFPDGLTDQENYSLRFNPNHEWNYWSNLCPSEVLLFKCYDSASDGLARLEGREWPSRSASVAGLSPHSAFFNTDAPTEGILRISLELRTLLFYG